ncbi:hypothetical protein JFU49_14565 [Pseudomonas sp. TH03]|uniref:hypothetical protein n=1 Tax=Pseudomonas sp. TH03 TaxID=2796369 RepID=UPI0019131B5F|nr:hypothetical protein [Pseudomonas sp. TH03]MBK5551482.1 hypothetical protein [Pseudomonas sp. TH03]
MPNLFITGYGIEQAALNPYDLAQCLTERPDDLPDNQPGEAKLLAAIVPHIAREDRAMLTSQTICSLNVGFLAMSMAQQHAGFTLDEKDAMCVYTTYETVRDFHEVIWQFKSSSEHYTNKDFLFANLGKLPTLCIRCDCFASCLPMVFTIYPSSSGYAAAVIRCARCHWVGFPCWRKLFITYLAVSPAGR